MGATAIAGLVLQIIAGLVDLVQKIKTEGEKKPEEVRDALHGMIDEHMKPWLPDATKAADDKFNAAG